MRALEFITGHVIYNLAYTYKFQLKTTYVFPRFIGRLRIMLTQANLKLRTADSMMEK